MNRTRWIATLGAIAVLALAGVWLRSRGAGDAPRYRTAPAERGYIETVVSATGTILPVEQVEIGSQVSGTVSRLYADYNSRVAEGQVLCQLEPSSLKARAASAEAAVARAEAALREGRRQLARSNELVKTESISQVDVEGAEVTVDQREADLKQARAQLDAAQVDLANATIRSPIDGVVIARSVDLGQTVAASLQAPKLFVIAKDLTRMQVETRIDEADIGRIRPGLPVLFTVDAFPEEQFMGEVAQVRLEPIVEQNVVTYTTVIHTANKELKLRPGMTANVSVRIASRDDALKVPNSALRFRPPSDLAKKSAGAKSEPRAATVGGAAGARAATPAPASGDAQASPAPARAEKRGAAATAGKPKAASAPKKESAASAKDDLFAGEDYGHAELEKRMKARGMPDEMIQHILERHDQSVADMKAQGMSPEEIRERLRQRLEAMRSGAGGGMTGGGEGGSGAQGAPLTFRNFKSGEASGGVSSGAAKDGGAPHRAEPVPAGPVVMGTVKEAPMKPGSVWVLRGGKLVKVSVMTGLTDGGYTEVTSDELKSGDEVIVGLEASAKNAGLQPPPGMGGSPFGGGGRGR